METILKNGDFTLELIGKNDENIVDNVLAMESLFPKRIQDSRERVVEYLNDPGNINILLKKGREVIGYALAIPHNIARIELAKDDPAMGEDNERYYVDKIALIPEFRKGLVFTNLIKGIFVAAGKKGINKLSAHIIESNGLNKIIMRVYKKIITNFRSVKLLSYDNIPCTYVDVNFGGS